MFVGSARGASSLKKGANLRARQRPRRVQPVLQKEKEKIKGGTGGGALQKSRFFFFNGVNLVAGRVSLQTVDN